MSSADLALSTPALRELATALTREILMIQSNGHRSARSRSRRVAASPVEIEKRLSAVKGELARRCGLKLDTYCDCAVVRFGDERFLFTGPTFAADARTFALSLR